MRRHVLAVDPALGKSGLCLLTLDGWQDVVDVLDTRVVRTQASHTLEARLASLYRRMRAALREMITVPTDVVVENPTDFWRMGGRRGGVRVAASLGAGFGVVALAVQHAYTESTSITSVTFYRSHDWLRTFGGGRLLKHDEMIRRTSAMHAKLASLSDDEVTAAALAVQHHYRCECEARP